MTRIWVLAVLPILAGFQGCSHNASLAAPGKADCPNIVVQGDSQQQRRRITPSQQLADETPEFGGAFIQDGVLNVYLTDQANHARAQAIIQKQLARQGRPNLPVRFVRGEFSYLYLERLVHQLFATIGAMSGFTMIGIDEWKNRVRIGVANEAVRPAMVCAIKVLKVPSDAIVFEKFVVQ